MNGSIAYEPDTSHNRKGHGPAPDRAGSEEDNGMFYGDEILDYPESQFPDIQYSNSPIKAYLKDGVIIYKI